MPENNTYHLTLLRHGESVGNAEGYHQGQSEFPLTEQGTAQAQALAALWKSSGTTFDFVISSPQSRASQTAEIIASALGLQVKYDDLWKERDNGVLSGMHHEEASQKYPQPAFIHPYSPIGQNGESQWELYLRAGHAVQSILHRSPGAYLVVSHGGILNMTLQAILGITPQANFQGARFRWRNTAYATLTYHPDTHAWIVEGTNQHPHWSEA